MVTEQALIGERKIWGKMDEFKAIQAEMQSICNDLEFLAQKNWFPGERLVLVANLNADKCARRALAIQLRNADGQRDRFQSPQPAWSFGRLAGPQGEIIRIGPSCL